ncbi:UNVERIFIED_ORG: hypothetical protein E4P37_10630 [Bacillus sp. AZ43]
MSDPGRQEPPWGPPGGYPAGPHHPPPGPPPGPPAWGPPPWGPPAWGPPPERRTSRWLTVGLPIGGVLLLVGCGALVYATVSSISGAVGPAQDAVEDYATALVEQRWDDAHDMLCDETAARMSADDLEELYGEPELAGFGLDGVHVSSYNGRTTGDATITFTYEQGMEQQVALPLVEDDDGWRVCP